jgi:hypothetical protein
MGYNPIHSYMSMIMKKLKINIFTTLRTSELNTNFLLFVKFRCSQCASDPQLWMGWIQLCGSLLSEIWLWRSSRSVFLSRRLLQWFNESVNVSYTDCMHRACTDVESSASILSLLSLFQPLLVHPKVSHLLWNNKSADYQIFILVSLSNNLITSN